jgi:hypothetical protein
MKHLVKIVSAIYLTVMQTVTGQQVGEADPK